MFSQVDRMPETDETSETGSLSEDHKKSCRSFLSDPTSRHWRFLAYSFGATSVLLLAGLAASLGVFLTKTECGAPPSLYLATSNYLGSASPGRWVTYVCQHPLVFPDNSNTFRILCNENLQWYPTYVPSCGSRTERQCTVREGGAYLTLTTRSTLTSLEVQVTLRGPIPPSLVVDIPAGDETMCSYTNMTRTSSESGAPLSRLWSDAKDEFLSSQEEKVHTVVVEDTTVDPRAPYEVRFRSIGATVALSLLQREYVQVYITSFNISSTTPSPSTTVYETKETESALTASTEAYSSTPAATAADSSTAAPTIGAIPSTAAATDTDSSTGTTSTAEESSITTDEFTSIFPERDPFITET